MDRDERAQGSNPPPAHPQDSKGHSRLGLGRVMAGMRSLEDDFEQMEHTLEEAILGDNEEPADLRLDAGRFRGIRDEMNKEVSKDNPYDIMMRGLIPLFIIGNAVFMGYIADRPREAWMGVCEHLFTAFFAQEMLLAFLREGFRNYFYDEWRYLDFLLAWLSILDTWILTAFVVEGPFSAFLVLRVLRVLRVIRLLRLLKVKKELMMMTAGIVSSMKTMCWMMILLLIVVFAAGLFCLSAINIDAYSEHDEFDAELQFGSLSRSMLTMFNIMLLDGWADLIWPVFVTQPMLVIFFIGFLLFTTFGALNVVVGIVSEQAIEVGREHQDIEDEKARRLRMHGIIQLADELFKGDTDGRGISASQLSALAMGSKSLMEELSAVELPRGFSMNDLHVMFDHEYSEFLSKDAFINGMFRLIFNNEFQRDCCTTLQVSLLRKQMHQSFRELYAELHVLISNMGPELPVHAVSSGAQEDAPCAEESVAPHPGLEVPWKAITPQMSQIAGWNSACTPRDAPPFANDGLTCMLREVQAEMKSLRAIPEQLRSLYSVPEQLQGLRFILQELQASQPHEFSAPDHSVSPGPLQETVDGLEQRLLAAQRSLVVEVAAMARLAEPSPEPLVKHTLRQVAQGQLSARSNGKTMFTGQRPHEHVITSSRAPTTSASDLSPSLAPCTV